MCRNIRTLFNFDPPATDDEIRASALQFVRKLSGFAQPSRVNEAAFNQAVEEVTQTARRLLGALETTSPAKNREAEAVKARARDPRAIRMSLVAGSPAKRTALKENVPCACL